MGDFQQPVFELNNCGNAIFISASHSCKFVRKVLGHIDIEFCTKAGCVETRSGANEKIIALHDSVCKCGKRFCGSHFGVNNVANDREFPVRIEEAQAKFRGECLEGESICHELILIVFDPIVDFNVLEGHQYVPNLVLICDFAFMEVRFEVLDQLRKDGRGDGSRGEDGSRFVSFMEFYCGHVLHRGCG